MAEVAELFFFPFEEADDDDDDGGADYSESLEDSIPFWPSASVFDPGDLFVPVFSPGRHPRRQTSGESSDSDEDSDSGSEYLDDPVSLALDLFDRRPLQPQRESLDPFPETLDSSDFRVLDGIDDMGSDYLGLGLGFGSGFERQEDGVGGGNRDVGSDWGGGGGREGLFPGRRSPVSGSREFPRVDGEGLRIVGFGSDSDSDDERVAALGNDSEGSDAAEPVRVVDDLPLPLCWDCLRIDEDRRDPDEDFEWEEVDGRLDEREVLSMMVGVDEDGSDGRGEFDHGDDVDLVGEEARRNVEWEVLLAMNNLGTNPSVEHEDAESYLGDDHEDFINTSEYEILFGQFADHDSFLKGSPPAAKSVVENLPSIILTEEDVAKNNTLCAVCKDEISLEGGAKQLPCLHHYHGDCILPWLGIRNTCPVCRYELPTDDPEYENWRARRPSGAGPTEESPVRYDFEMFPEV